MERYGCTITVNSGQVSSAQNNFSWLITQDNLPTAAIDGGSTSILNGGGNLRCYTDDTKTTQLPIEVVAFVTGLSPQVVVWGLSPLLGVASTVYIEADTVATTQPPPSGAYGSEAVWVDFELIVHQGSSVDSSGNHSPVLNGSPSLVSMMWGGQAYNLATTSQYLQIPHSASLSLGKNYSISSWNNVTNNGTSGQHIASKSANNDSEYRFFKKQSTTTPNSRQRQPDLTPSNLDDTPTQFGLTRDAFTFDGVTRSTYRDGVFRVSDNPTGSVSTNNEDVFLGYLPGEPGAFNGAYGDLWVSNSASGANRQEAEYNNQSSPSTFWSTGTWEDQGGGGVVVSGDINFDIDTVEFSSTGSATVPQPNGDISFELSAVEFASTGTASLPNPSGNVSFDLYAIEFSGTGSATVAFPVGNVAFDIYQMEFSGEGGATQPNPSGNIEFDVATVEFYGLGSATQPDPVGSISFDIETIEFSSTGSVAGLTLPYGEIIKPKTESNVIILNTPPNLIKLY